MTHDLSAIVTQYGLAVVFGNVLVEQLGVPAPGVNALVFAKFVPGLGLIPAKRT